MLDQVSDIISLCKQHYFKDNAQVRKHISAAVRLCKDEEILFALSTGYCTRGRNTTLINAVILVTNRQLLISAHAGAMVSRPVLQSIGVEHIVSANVTKKLALASIRVEIVGSPVLILQCLPKQEADAVCTEFLNAVSKAKKLLHGNQPTAADEILKYKYLLDMGAISQAEFAEKKLHLLNQK